MEGGQELVCAANDAQYQFSLQASLWRRSFLLRFLLAATLTPNYGMYSGYELRENEPASDSNEMRPPCSSTILRVTDSPMPVPRRPFVE